MVITASQARTQLFPLIEQVNNDSMPITITSKKGNAVLISESEWEAMLETIYLLRTPTNRKRLAKSKAEALSGKLFEYELPMARISLEKKSATPMKKRAVKKEPTKAKKTTATAKVVKRAKKKTSS